MTPQRSPARPGPARASSRVVDGPRVQVEVRPDGPGAVNEEGNGRAKEEAQAPIDSEIGEERARTRVIAIVNQKGGVGKSTTAVSLGAALADMGRRVLVVDLDPQGNASTGLGIRHAARDVTTYEVLLADQPLDQAVVPTEVERLWAVPSTIDLAGAEIELVSQFSREMRLARALEPAREGAYEFVFLDCPPSLGLLTINALAASDEILVPIQCEYYALEGLGQLLRNVRLIQHNLNPRLRLTGIVLTMFDSRTKLAEQVVGEVRRYFGPRVYDTIIPRAIRLSEAPGYGLPITAYDPGSKGAESYRALAREVDQREDDMEELLPPIEGLPAFIPPATRQAAGEGRERAAGNGGEEAAEPAAETSAAVEEVDAEALGEMGVEREAREADAQGGEARAQAPPAVAVDQAEADADEAEESEPTRAVVGEPELAADKEARAPDRRVGDVQVPSEETPQGTLDDASEPERAVEPNVSGVGVEAREPEAGSAAEVIHIDDDPLADEATEGLKVDASPAPPSKDRKRSRWRLFRRGGRT